MQHETITGSIIDAALTVHSALGPGLLESTYEACLLFELHRQGLKAISQVELPVVYQGVKIDAGYRIDLLVEDTVVVELKSVEKILPIHQAQLLSCLKLSGKPVGLLIQCRSSQGWPETDGQLLISSSVSPRVLRGKSSGRAAI